MSETRSLLLRLASVLVLGSLAASDAAAGPAELLARAEQMMPVAEGRVRLAWTIGSARATEGPMEIDVYVGAEGSWLAILRSGKQAGRRLLRTGDRSWLLLPGTKNPVPLAGQQRLSGLAAASEIAGLRLAHDFTAKARADREDRQGASCDVLDLEAARDGLSWAGGALWIGAEDHLPRELRLRVSSGKEARAVAFVAFRKDHGRDTVRRMEIRDLLRRGQGKPDVVEILELAPGSIDPSTFTVEGARAVR